MLLPLLQGALIEYHLGPVPLLLVLLVALLDNDGERDALLVGVFAVLVTLLWFLVYT